MWNYRVIDFGTHKALHEVHYDDDGKPSCYTSEPITFVCEPDEDIASALEMALDDVRKYPALTPADFGVLDPIPDGVSLDGTLAILELGGAEIERSCGAHNLSVVRS